jgi:OmpA-OmpF porin, OOP family
MGGDKDWGLPSGGSVYLKLRLIYKAQLIIHTCMQLSVMYACATILDVHKMKKLCILAFFFISSTLRATPEDTQQIIDALSPVKTRGFRNLSVKPLPAIASSPSIGSSPPSPVSNLVSLPPERPSLSMAISFEFNSAKISPSSQKDITRVGKALVSPVLVDFRFLIEGHTDAKGSEKYNRKLSQLRADEVKRMLILLGVAPERLDSIGLGADMPADPQNIFSAENRRVRIVNLIQLH